MELGTKKKESPAEVYCILKTALFRGRLTNINNDSR